MGVEVVISVAKQYSETPAGRYRSDSPRSGEQFREELLLPALRAPEGPVVVVDLDGTLGFGSSFLEEAFGGLVRAGLSGPELHSRLKIRSEVSTYETRAWKYIDEADRRRT